MARKNHDNETEAALVKAIADERSSLRRVQSVLHCMRLAVVNHGEECPSNEDLANGMRAVSELLEGIRERFASGHVRSAIDRSHLTDKLKNEPESYP